MSKSESKDKQTLTPEFQRAIYEYWDRICKFFEEKS